MICSNCNNIVPDNSDFCPNCGLQLVTKPTTHISPSVCPNCGSREYFKNGKCVSCGRKNSRAVKNKKFIIAFAAFASVMIIAVGFFFVLAAGLGITCDEYKAKTVKYEEKYKTISEDYEEMSESYSMLSEDYEDLEKLGGEFFNNYAVIVHDDGSNVFHRYWCSKRNSEKGFWIFNIDAAKEKGFSACTQCCSDHK